MDGAALDQNRCRGTVAWFNLSKGYGFLRPDAGEDVFVHIRELENSGIGGLKQNDVVEFEVTQGRNDRSCAKNIKFISSGRPR